MNNPLINNNLSEAKVLTIFGASGDLAKLKIYPGIFALAVQNMLPDNFLMMGYSRSQISNEDFRSIVRESILKKYPEQADSNILRDFLTKCFYFSGQYNQREDFKRFKDYISEHLGQRIEDSVHVCHFSVPPSVFEDIIINLADTRVQSGTSLNEASGEGQEDIRLVIEKPFGYDQHSANELYHTIGTRFDENQVFLLDHYLGKRVIQSILKLRQTNKILSEMLRGQIISNIQITAYEDFGVKERLGYFNEVGIIRDFVQSHMLQMLALLTMSVPISKSADNLRREKDTILSALNFDPHTGVLVGQYGSYKSQDEKVHDSQTDTFAALRLTIDRQDWYKVPIYLRVGKNLSKTMTNIVVEFEKFGFQNPDDPPNRLIFHTKPTEEVELEFINWDDSGHQKMKLGQNVACDDDVCLNEHGQLLYEVMQNNGTNFLSFEEILASWRLVDDILNCIDSHNIETKIYEDGSHGPDGLHEIPGQDGNVWHEL